MYKICLGLAKWNPQKKWNPSYFWQGDVTGGVSVCWQNKRKMKGKKRNAFLQQLIQTQWGCVCVGGRGVIGDVRRTQPRTWFKNSEGHHFCLMRESEEDDDKKSLTHPPALRLILFFDEMSSSTLQSKDLERCLPWDKTIPSCDWQCHNPSAKPLISSCRPKYWRSRSLWNWTIYFSFKLCGSTALRIHKIENSSLKF